MQVVIRESNFEDWKIIQELNHQVFQVDQDHDSDLNMDWPFSDEGVEYYKQVANGEIGKCFVACEEDQVIGYIALAEKVFGYRKSKYLEIDNMGVDQKYRSQGIGKLLVEKAGEWAGNHGFARLFVSAYWENHGANNFYRKNGFTEIGIMFDKILK